MQVRAHHPEAAGREGEEEQQDPEVLAMQAMYVEMEREFMDKMNLKEEDLPPGYSLPSSEDILAKASNAAAGASTTRRK